MQQKGLHKMQVLKKIWNILSTVIVVVAVLCAIFLMGSRIMGVQVFNVLTGSMMPEYYPGDLIFVQKVDPATIEVGDDVTILLGENLSTATHRVIANDHEKSYIRTQGLANSDPDKPTHYNNVVGVVVFSVPKLGYVTQAIQKPPGTYITVAVCAILILLIFLPDFISKKSSSTTAKCTAEPTGPDALDSQVDEGNAAPAAADNTPDQS